MTFMENIRARARDPRYRKRIAMSFSGIVISGVSVGMIKVSNLGTDPFQVLVAGLDAVTPLPFGVTYAAICAILLIAMFFLGRRYIGVGTLLNLFFLGYIVEFSQGILNRLLPAPSLLIRLLLLLAAVVILCYASALYITADLGVSTYDVWALLLAEKTRGPFRLIRIGTDLVCVIVGWLLGGTVGVGTLVTAFCMGPLIDFFNRKAARPMLYGKRA